MKFNLENLIKKKIFKDINYYKRQNNVNCNKCINIPESIILDYKKRIVVIGDIHGDFNSLLQSLYIAEVINKNCDWIGKNTIVIQLGDQLDKGGRDYLSVDTTNDKLEELKVRKKLQNDVIELLRKQTQETRDENVLLLAENNKRITEKKNS